MDALFPPDDCSGSSENLMITVYIYPGEVGGIGSCRIGTKSDNTLQSNSVGFLPTHSDCFRCFPLKTVHQIWRVPIGTEQSETIGSDGKIRSCPTGSMTIRLSGSHRNSSLQNTPVYG